MKKSAITAMMIVLGVSVFTGCTAAEHKKENRTALFQVTVSAEPNDFFINNEANNENVAVDWLESQAIAEGTNEED